MYYVHRTVHILRIICFSFYILLCPRNMLNNFIQLLVFIKFYCYYLGDVYIFILILKMKHIIKRYL